MVRLEEEMASVAQQRESMNKISFTIEYWDWLKSKGYKEEDCKKIELLNEFYYSYFHHKHPKYIVNGLEYFEALGKL